MKKRQHLLVQHLENLSRRVLEEYQDIIRQYVKGRRGLYALYRRDKLQYVGLASDLRSRLRRHLRDRHARTWDSFSLYLTLGADSLRELEALLIRIAKPRGNRSKTRFPRSQDLRKVFTHQVRVKQHDELDSLFVESIRRTRSPTRKRTAPTAPLGRYVRKRFAIQLTYKGRTYKALVRRDGTIRLRARVFRSPSMAAVLIIGRPVNGWSLWKYERAPGEWVRIDELRK